MSSPPSYSEDRRRKDRSEERRDDSLLGTSPSSLRSNLKQSAERNDEATRRFDEKSPPIPRSKSHQEEEMSDETEEETSEELIRDGEVDSSSQSKLDKLRREEEKIRLQTEAINRERLRVKKEKEDLFKNLSKKTASATNSPQLSSHSNSGTPLMSHHEYDSEKESTTPGEEALSDAEEEDRPGKRRDSRTISKVSTKKAEEALRSTKESLKKEKERLRREKDELYRKQKEDLKKESARLRRLSYDREHKEVDDLMSGWVKMRGSLKNWHLRWLVLRPGKLIYYRDDLAKDCLGIILLNDCVVAERATKKEGHCFKIYHPKEHNIFSSKGLKGQPLPSGLVPVSSDHAILRVPTDIERTKWMTAIEAAVSTQKSLRASVSEDNRAEEYDDDESEEPATPIQRERVIEIENVITQREVLPSNALVKSHSLDSLDSKKKKKSRKETVYVPEVRKTVTAQGAAQEELVGESKNLILSLVKQVRPGMDLTKIALPTFILEPRSTLEKLSDFMTHSELLAEVPKLNSAVDRMVSMLKWYLSGFYIKPEGVKKPYNPIIGELFRARWNHPDGSNTFFINEQISHHPPICAFYISNRKANFIINGDMTFRSKFFGTSAGSILEGYGTVYILNHGEEYEFTFPSAYAKGILFGTLYMELGGNTSILCHKSGLRAEIEFKQKPILGGEYNVVAAKIKKENHTLFTVTGKWDGQIEITDQTTGTTSVLWEPTSEVRRNVIPKLKPPMEEMAPFESDKLWSKVTDAIKRGDQKTATEEKFLLESAQREATKERERKGVEWKPKLFTKTPQNVWTYNYFNKQPWNADKEIEEYEYRGVIRSKKLVDSASSESEDEAEFAPGDPSMSEPKEPVHRDPPIPREAPIREPAISRESSRTSLKLTPPPSPRPRSSPQILDRSLDKDPKKDLKSETVKPTTTKTVTAPSPPDSVDPRKWKTIEDRLYRIEKDLVALHHVRTVAQPPRPYYKEHAPLIALFLLWILLRYFFL